MISKVKKLQTVQQLTASLLPSCTVNVMSHEEDRCFQCQEFGLIACDCPNLCCFECHEYGHIVVDCPHWIPPSGTPAHHHKQIATPGIAQGLLLDKITRTGTKTADQGPSPIPADIIVTVIMAPTEAIPDHIIETVDATIGALCNVMLTSIAMHRSSSTYLKDCSRSQSCSAYKTSKKTPYKPSSHSSRTPVKPQDRRHHRVMIAHKLTTIAQMILLVTPKMMRAI